MAAAKCIGVWGVVYRLAPDSRAARWAELKPKGVRGARLVLRVFQEAGRRRGEARDGRSTAALVRQINLSSGCYFLSAFS
jgi:hypothetical protein